MVALCKRFEIWWTFTMIKRTKALLPKLAFMEFQQCVFWRRSLLRYFSSSAHVEISPLLRFTSERNRDECSVYIPVKILGFISWILNIWRLSSWISSVKSLQIEVGLTPNSKRYVSDNKIIPNSYIIFMALSSLTESPVLCSPASVFTQKWEEVIRVSFLSSSA